MMRGRIEPVLASSVTIQGGSLTIEEVERVARLGAPVHLHDEAAARMQASIEILTGAARAGRSIYGLTTGVGALDTEGAGLAEDAIRQRRLLLSHAAGVGPAMRDDQVRAMMLARANTLAVGRSAIRPEVVRALLELLNHGVTPVVPEIGSIGASDLAPLSHMALVLVGEGQARLDGEILPAREALRRVGLAPVELRGRDGFALINGLAQTVALGALAVADATRLVMVAEEAAALSLLATGAPRDFLDARTAEAKGQPGQARSAARLRILVDGGSKDASLTLRATLSTRYAPQVAGAARAALELARRSIETELAAAVDNPMVFSDGWVTSNSGATSGQEVAQALDLLTTSMTSLAVIAERRIANLLDADASGLPPFLRHPAASPGVDSGMMMVQYTAAALVAELRTRSTPASIQSIPVCAGSEDHSSMSALAARQATFAVEAAQTVVAIELYAACQAVDLAGVELPAALAPLHAAVRSLVPPLVEDRLLAADIEAVRRLLAAGVLW